MKLNQDCIRDLLLHIEENLSLGNFFDISSDFHEDTLSNYSTDDLIYTALKLLEANYIDANILRFIDTRVPKVRIKSITYQGHQFLDSIRDKSVWESTKAKASKFASVSLPILQQIATTFIQSQLGLS